MREVALDTETTGLDPEAGHRIVEIGAVELSNQVPTGHTYHQYVNPDRTVPKEAHDVHGLDDAFLEDKPKFAEVAGAFLEFLGDAKLVIHNASFDMKFINSELRWANRPPLPDDRVIDTLTIARKKFPGSPISLDALCRRFGIDNSARVQHSALMDSELLAEVYLELTGGRQPDFAFATRQAHPTDQSTDAWRPAPRDRKLPSRITEEEAKAHAAFVDELGENALWKKFGTQATD